MIESAKGLRGWRKAVHDAAEDATRDLCWLDGPLRLRVFFYLPRPKHHYRTGRFAGQLKADAPRFCTRVPDTDKLVRAIGDALTGLIYGDDSQVAQIVAHKLYGDTPGAFITITELEG